MSNLVWTREQFSLATIEGEDALETAVALDIEYDHRGEWKITGAGAVQEWGGPPPGFRRYTDKIVWFQAECALEQLIIARAIEKYSDDIDEYVRRLAREDAYGDYEETH